MDKLYQVAASSRALALFFLSARPRVRFIIYLGEMLKIKVSIDLGRADVRMPEQLLDRPQITAGLHHMGCKAMAKQMRIDALWYAGLDGPVTHSVLNGARTDAVPTNADKKGNFIVGREFRATAQPVP